ncbi:MAG: hypothetical protein J0M34_02410 [Alphaproteobacteria bacterium]|nr:hypothetical protein [Alphaproteobacteria bacterium]
MLGTLKTLLGGKEEAQPPVKAAIPLTKLETGSALEFSNDTLIPELRGKKASIQAVRTYRFGETTTVSYILTVDAVDSLILTIAQDDQGYYLGMSRELSPEEQHQWFDRDALSFFTELSSAKTLKAKVTDAQFPNWVAPKYVKTIEFMDGTLTQGRLSTSDAARKTQNIQYSLLVNDAGDKAVEIEVYPELKTHRVYVTVYRPAEDIKLLSQPIPMIPAPTTSAPKVPVKAIEPAAAPKTVVTPAPKPVAQEEKPTPQRPDFRRLNMADHAPVIKRPAAVKVIDEDLEASPVPAFLTAEPKPVTRSKYLTLDEVLPPEIERVRCDMATAKLLIDTSMKRGVRVRDILRMMTGLQAPAHDEVLFEMPLSDEDYKQLAQRYQLKPDMRAEIRSRMMDELQKKLKKMNG